MRSAKLICAVFLAWSASAQSDTSALNGKDHFDMRGYIKNMQTATFTDDLNTVVSDNLIHNRLNFRVYPIKGTTVGIELRNRIFWGETVDQFTGYSELLAQDDGLVDMSFLIVDEPSLIILSQVDRAWVEWANGLWEVRVGRQRINWGTNLFWNTNDLFNVYSIVDFDYEERPGTDAIRVQRYFSNMSAVDVAFRPGKGGEEGIISGMYRFNARQYDFQLLAASWFDDLVLGAGWAGNLWTAGFKGESTLFIPKEEGSTVLSTSLSMDYVFDNQLFLTAGYLFNSTVDPMSTGLLGEFTGERLTAKSLMPAEHSYLVSGAYPINPILSTSLVAIHSPEMNSLFIMPSLGYSIANNWEVALFGQSFWITESGFDNQLNAFYIRFKGSF